MQRDLLLLRGLIRESGHWFDWIERLQRRNEWSHIHVIDFPGVGTEWMRSCPVHLDQILEDVRTRLPHFETSPDVLALSMGGMLALRWGELYGWDQFHTLALVNTSARDVAPFWERLNARQFPKIAKLFLSNNLKAREEVILELTAQNLSGERRENYLAHAIAIGEKRPLSKKTAFRQLLAAARFKAPAEVSIPLFMAVSLEDRLVSPKCSLALSERYRVSPVLFPENGHDVVLESPDSFENAWMHFIKLSKTDVLP